MQPSYSRVYPVIVFGAILTPFSETAPATASRSRLKYIDGRIDSLLLLTIPPGGELNLVRTNPPNACAHPEEGESLYGSFAETCLLYDSVVVTFDSLRKSTHKRYNDSLGCAHCILFDSPRAFSNEANWVTTVISECKRRKAVTKTYTYTYTFREDDYLNAR